MGHRSGQVSHRSGKSQGGNIVFKVREKSGNFDLGQGKSLKSGENAVGQGKLKF